MAGTARRGAATSAHATGSAWSDRHRTVETTDKRRREDGRRTKTKRLTTQDDLFKMTRRIQRSDDDTMTDFETNKVFRKKTTDDVVDEISIIMFKKCITFNLISELIIVLLYFFLTMF